MKHEDCAGHRHVLGGRAPARHRHPGRGARRHRPLQRRPRGQRLPGAAAAARRASTRSRPCWPSTRPRTSTACTRSTSVAWCSGRRASCPARRRGSSSCCTPTTSPSKGRHVVIIGRGVTIGRPLANLLSLKRPGCNAAVTVRAHRRRASATWPPSCARPTSSWRRPGGPHLVTPDMVKPGAAVVSAGTSFEGQEAHPRRAPGRGRGGRVDHAPPRRGRSHDPCHAVAQRVAGGGAGGEVTHRPSGEVTCDARHHGGPGRQTAGE